MLCVKKVATIYNMCWFHEVKRENKGWHSSKWGDLQWLVPEIRRNRSGRNELLDMICHRQCHQKAQACSRRSGGPLMDFWTGLLVQQKQQKNQKSPKQMFTRRIQSLSKIWKSSQVCSSKEKSRINQTICTRVMSKCLCTKEQANQNGHHHLEAKLGTSTTTKGTTPRG